MMVPVQLGLIPLYMLMAQAPLAGTLPVGHVPFLVSGFGVFMMRQYAIQAVPDELIEAAGSTAPRRSGSSCTWCFPSCGRPPRCSALLTFMERWNDFLWPYLVARHRAPDRAGRAVAARRRLLHRPGAGHRRHPARRPCRCSSCSSSSAARSSAASWKVRSRRDRCRSQLAPAASGTALARRLPAGLRLGRGDRGVPDRGRVDRGRPGAVDLGHLRRPARAGSATATPASRRATTTTATARTSTLMRELGLGAYRFSVCLAADPARRRRPGQPRRPGLLRPAGRRAARARASSRG